MGWGHFARPTNPKTCWNCKDFQELGGFTKYIWRDLNNREEFINTEIAKQKCIYKKKQAKYPEQYPNPYKPYGWLKNARKEE